MRWLFGGLLLDLCTFFCIFFCLLLVFFDLLFRRRRRWFLDLGLFFDVLGPIEVGEEDVVGNVGVVDRKHGDGVFKRDQDFEKMEGSQEGDELLERADRVVTAVQAP